MPGLPEVRKWLKATFEINGKWSPASDENQSNDAIMTGAEFEWKETCDHDHVKVKVENHNVFDCVSNLATTFIFVKVNE